MPAKQPDPPLGPPRSAIGSARTEGGPSSGTGRFFRRCRSTSSGTACILMQVVHSPMPACACGRFLPSLVCPPLPHPSQQMFGPACSCCSAWVVTLRTRSKAGQHLLHWRIPASPPQARTLPAVLQSTACRPPSLAAFLIRRCVPLAARPGQSPCTPSARASGGRWAGNGWAGRACRAEVSAPQACWHALPVHTESGRVVCGGSNRWSDSC